MKRAYVYSPGSTCQENHTMCYKLAYKNFYGYAISFLFFSSMEEHGSTGIIYDVLRFSLYMRCTVQIQNTHFLSNFFLEIFKYTATNSALTLVNIFWST